MITNPELILGGAQLGFAYGVNNEIGRLSRKSVFSLLDAAYDAGIRSIDTAAAYGDSEAIIGEYAMDNARTNDFFIDTKLSFFKTEGLPDSEIRSKVACALNESRSTLEPYRIRTYYLHDFSALSSEAIVSTLVEMRKTGCFERIGVSIYEPAELKTIIEHYADLVSIVQIPLNPFNASTWLQALSVLSSVKDSFMLTLRSVYLQGVLLMDPQNDFVCSHELADPLKAFLRVAHDEGMTPKELALAFAKSFPYTEGVIIGSEAVDQVRENVRLFQTVAALSEKSYNKIIEIGESVNADAIDPRKW